MQAIEKIDISSDWVTLTFIILLIIIFLLKGLNGTKLREYFFAFFNKGFIQSEVEERTSFFNLFSFTIFSFTVLNFGLLIFFLITQFFNINILSASFFKKTALVIFSYLIIKWTLEYLFSKLFSIQNQITFFLKSKNIYSYTLSLWIFPLLIVFFYTDFDKKIILIIIALLWVLKFLLLLINNKNLILNKLFYFMLYICAFEIAPIFVLFKLIF